jgi:hypothetical protein
MLALSVLVSTSDVSARKVDEHFSINFSERFRFTSWDNALSLDKYSGSAATFTRHRTSLEGVWQPVDQFNFHLKLTNEFRYYIVPTTGPQTLHEIFFDNLFFAAKPFVGLPVTFTIGRQNIMLDEGFIMMDGTPLDGSRSIYFNAARADWHIGNRHTLTGFFCYQDTTDSWLPVVHDQDQRLLETIEEGYGVYYKRPINNADLSLYVVHKSYDLRSGQHYVTTLGGRIALPVAVRHRFVLESAIQDGRWNSTNTSGYGGYAYFDFVPSFEADPWFIPRLLSLGTIILSGDDPRTVGYEGWDPMFARWPKWSEAYIYTLIPEQGGVAYWTNLLSLYGVIGFDFSSDVEFNFVFHHMKSMENAPTAPFFVLGTGKTRGNLLIGHLGYSFATHWTGHIHWEGFLPGDYYFEDSDSYSWLRMELMFRY